MHPSAVRSLTISKHTISQFLHINFIFCMTHSSLASLLVFVSCLTDDAKRWLTDPTHYLGPIRDATRVYTRTTLLLHIGINGTIHCPTESTHHIVPVCAATRWLAEPTHRIVPFCAATLPSEYVLSSVWTATRLTSASYSFCYLLFEPRHEIQYHTTRHLTPLYPASTHCFLFDPRHD